VDRRSRHCICCSIPKRRTREEDGAVLDHNSCGVDWDPARPRQQKQQDRLEKLRCKRLWLEDQPRRNVADTGPGSGVGVTVEIGSCDRDP